MSLSIRPEADTEIAFRQWLRSIHLGLVYFQGTTYNKRPITLNFVELDSAHYAEFTCESYIWRVKYFPAEASEIVEVNLFTFWRWYRYHRDIEFPETWEDSVTQRTFGNSDRSSLIWMERLK